MGSEENVIGIQTFQRADTTSALELCHTTSPGKDKSSARLEALAWVTYGWDEWHRRGLCV